MSLRQTNKRSFYLENLGCSKNQVDAEIMITRLIGSGWTYTESADDADCIIVNTCGFIEPAKKESIETALSFREFYPDKKIIMAGCFAQRYGEDLLDQLPEINGVFGNRNLSMVDKALSSVFRDNRTAVLPAGGSEYPERAKLLSFPGSVNVKISEGCNHRCSYCAIPIIRGNLRSRTIREIVAEIKYLISKDIFEINLIAQDLGAFGTDRGKREFTDLLLKISELPGNFWVRLLYIYPDDFPFGILDIIEKDKRFLPYFDLPFQHASENVLVRMGRRGNRDKYLKLIAAIRERLPDAVIRSTFMVGFPSEGRKERNSLLSFLKEATLDWAGFFVYSREEDTRAYKMRRALSHKLAVMTAEKFKPRLEEVQEEISRQRMSRFVGLDLDILIEENVLNEPFSFGRGYPQAPEVDGSTIVLSENLTPGRVVRCRIIKQNGIDLEARPIDEL